MRVFVLLATCVAWPALGLAQPAALPKHDASVSVGWAGSEYERSSYDRWHGSLLISASGGHYWTDHLKTEIDVSWGSPDKQDLYEDIAVQGGFTFAQSRFQARDIRFGVAQIYQFGRNQWVHPYLGAGADVVSRTTTKERGEQLRTVYVSNRNLPITIPRLHERASDLFVEPFLKTGLKMYAAERLFFTTELKLGIRRDIDHAVWKVGIGVDF